MLFNFKPVTYMLSCRHYALSSFSFLLLLLSSNLAPAQSDHQVRNEFNKIISPFDLSKTTSRETIDLLNNVLAPHQLIALGESSHGTKEFNIARGQLIRFLVTNQGLKTVAMETEFSGILELNSFILNGQEDTSDKALDPDTLLKSAIKNSSLYGIYKTKEVYDMIQWLRQYNITKPADQRVSLIGFDMQDASSIANVILKDSLLMKADSPAKVEDLKNLKKKYWEVNTADLTKTEASTYEKLIQYLYNLTETNGARLSPDFRQYVRILEQSLILRGRSMPLNKYRQLRDQFSAENVLWLFKTKSRDSKMAILAHNGHIAHASLSKTERMGYHLQKELGKKYFALAMAFDQGDVRIFDFKNERRYRPFFFPSATDRNSVEFFFKDLKYDTFLLNFTDVRSNELLTDMLNKKNQMRVIGATDNDGTNQNYSRVPLLESFDGILFFKKTTAAVNLFDYKPKN